MRHGSLFSGIGGFDLAAEWMGWENVFHCEWMEFPRKVLDYYWPGADSYTDICKTDFKKYANTIDILTGGFPCQPFSTAGKRKELKTNATCGEKCLEQFKKLNPHTSLQKTSLVSRILMAEWYSNRCALTWKLKGTKFNRLLFQLQPKTHRIDETEFGLWLSTPRVSEVPQSEKFAKGRTMSPSEYAMTIGMLPTPIAGDWKGQRRSDGTASMLSGKASLGMLPTPTVMDSTNATATMKSTQVKEGSMHSVTLNRAMAMGILPTPTAQIIKHSHKKEYWDKRIKDGRQEDLSMVVHGYNGMNSQLNPRFVAEMMGFPPNWTELPFLNGETNQSKDTETQ